MNDGTVLITGGYDVNENALASSELYNPVTGTFTTTGSLNTARRNFSITLLDDGTVIVTGGYDNTFNTLSSAEIYHPSTGTFTITGNLTAARADHTATLLNCRHLEIQPVILSVAKDLARRRRDPSRRSG